MGSKDMLQSLLENRERLKTELEKNEELIRLISKERKRYTLSESALAARRKGLKRIAAKRKVAKAFRDNALPVSPASE